VPGYHDPATAAGRTVATIPASPGAPGAGTGAPDYLYTR
jgi:hypothetical protein